MNNAGVSLVAPIVGLPMKVGEAYTLVSVTCRCRPDNPSQIIRGIDVGSKCLKCGKVYAIMAIRFDRASGQPMSCEVGKVGHAPTQGIS